MESSNDQNLFDMTSNNNFDFNTTPMVMDQSYDMGMQQVGNVMGTGWSVNDSFYGYQQTISRHEFHELLQRVSILNEQ